MGSKGIATDALARHLHAAIERVRADMEQVEFWADAVSGLQEPVPEYEPKDVTVWLPPEQAKKISRVSSANQGRQHATDGRSGDSKRRQN